MTNTHKYVIFREATDEFLHAVREMEGANRLLGWCKGPSGALKYESLRAATRVAQRIADNQGYPLTVCGLHESDTQVALANPIQLRPSTDPGMN
jgi:hypothetical protein